MLLAVSLYLIWLVIAANCIESTKSKASRRASRSSQPPTTGSLRVARRTRSERMRLIAGNFAELAKLFEEEASRWDSDDNDDEN